MAIESISSTTINSALSAKTGSKIAPENKQAANTAPGTDSIAFSNSSQDLQAAFAAAAATPVVNEDRVAAIKSAIKDGSYQVDANRLADKILQFDQQLANST